MKMETDIFLEAENALENLLDANEIVDKLLELVSEAIKGKFDPVELPAFEQRFVKRILVSISGKVSLDSGQLQGLSNVQRLGDAELNLDDLSGSLNLGVTFPAVSIVYQVNLAFNSVLYKKKMLQRDEPVING